MSGLAGASRKERRAEARAAIELNSLSSPHCCPFLEQFAKRGTDSQFPCQYSSHRMAWRESDKKKKNAAHGQCGITVVKSTALEQVD